MAPITHLDVSLNITEEQNLQARGFKKIDVNLNEGAGGDQIYIWYKAESGASPITRLQLTFNKDMEDGLINAGYTKINKDVNAGAGGNCVYFWYFKGQTEYDIPIVGIDVTTNAKEEGRKFTFGWERLACGLNRRTGGKWIYAWVKREKQTYICDVTVTDSYGSDQDLFENGYIRVDEETNRGARGAYVFIWYRQTTQSNNGPTGLQISTNDDEYQSLQQQGYMSISINLNQASSGTPVYLWWIKRQGDNPIKAITLIVNMDAVKLYEENGATVIKRNLNTGNKGSVEYLCVYQ